MVALATILPRSVIGAAPATVCHVSESQKPKLGLVHELSVRPSLVFAVAANVGIVGCDRSIELSWPTAAMGRLDHLSTDYWDRGSVGFFSLRITRESSHGTRAKTFISHS